MCEFARCLDGVCDVTPAPYGDVASAGGICGPDGSIDIAGVMGSCTPDEDINLSDILNVLDAFRGLDHCCSGGERE